MPSVYITSNSTKACPGLQTLVSAIVYIHDSTEPDISHACPLNTSGQRSKGSIKTSGMLTSFMHFSENKVETEQWLSQREDFRTLTPRTHPTRRVRLCHRQRLLVNSPVSLLLAITAEGHTSVKRLNSRKKTLEKKKGRSYVTSG